MGLDKKKLSGFLGVSLNDEKVSELENKQKQVLDYYEEYQISQELITDITFSQGNRRGLYFFKDGVQVILPREELLYNPHFDFDSILYMRRVYTVMVKSVDREEKIITLSYKQAQDKAKPEIAATIKAELAEQGSYRTYARISYITSPEKGICHVDILGVGIHGIIGVSEWSPSYTADMRMIAKPGDILPIVVTSIVPGKDGFDLYLCSRKRALEYNPWMQVEQKAPKTTTVLVRCLRKRDNYFLGAIEGLEEISCYCFYPKPGTLSSHTKLPVIINTGGMYSGYVSAVDGEKHILRVRILDDIPGQNESSEEALSDEEQKG